MSPKSTSACSPSETKCEKPMPREPAQSSMAVTSAPDCETKASSPGAAPMWAKLALSPRCGTSMPMQLGPRMRRVWRRAASSMCCFCAWSRPAVTTTAARVPRRPSSSMRPGTVAAGVQITARSGTWGSSATLAYTGTPPISRCLGLTPSTWPWKPARRLRQTVAPTLPGRSDAPSTATVAGANMASRLRMLKRVLLGGRAGVPWATSWPFDGPPGQ